jgi:glycosyltransferase involved in cell wall biosynthesis
VPEVRLSVAIVTRNRPESLERTLRSLGAQGSQPYEVLVSDDSSAEHRQRTRDIALAHGARYVSGPQRGLYANRNASALACTGSHIRTMDDDHEFPPGHIAACLDAVRRAPAVVWIIGECLPGEEGGEEAWMCPPQLNARGSSVTPLPGRPIWAIADGAAIYPREIFDRGLRFSESFRFGAAYMEWGSRLHWLGYEIRHLDTTYVIHHLDPAARSFNDVRITAGAHLFAALCHSFVYQPTLRNRALTVAELAATVRRRRAVGAYAVADALKAFRRRRRERSPPAGGPASASSGGAPAGRAAPSGAPDPQTR